MGLAHVFTAVAIVSKSPVAKFAHVWLLSSVNVHVVVIVLLAHEALLAYVALVSHRRGIPMLLDHVQLEVHVGDSDTALLTLFEGVLEPDVLVQMHLAFEHLPTLIALLLVFDVAVVHMSLVVSLSTLPPTDVADLGLGILFLPVLKVVDLLDVGPEKHLVVAFLATLLTSYLGIAMHQLMLL